MYYSGINRVSLLNVQNQFKLIELGHRVHI